MPQIIATRDAYGQALVELGERNPNIVVLDADLSKSTRTSKFAARFPERFFNFGVAEANMMGHAAGLAACGKTVFASSFAIFASGRAWEQVRNTIAYSGVNVKIVATHGGISVGADGSSHQCIEDIATMRAIPTMTVIVPCDGPETKKAIFAAAEHPGPVYIRLGRAPMPVITTPESDFEIGKAAVLAEGDDVAIVACGALVAQALEAARLLASQGTKAAVIDMHTLKPLDEEVLVEMARRCGAIVTAEEHVLDGGLGAAVAQVLVRNCPVPAEMVGIDNEFGQSGEPDVLFKAYHLTAEDIVKAAKVAINRKKSHDPRLMTK